MNPSLAPTTQAISVTDFVTIINETLAFAYPEVTVEGEVSSFKVNQGKFVFFDLKDEQNLLTCFMMAFALKLPIEDGMKVRITGTAKVTKFSKFSFTVKSVELAGEGALRRSMELLKRKLEAEGLFAASRKRELPAFPRRLGLITSGKSAAYADFMKILGERWGGLDVVLADIQVQGAAATDQIVGAVEYFNELPSPVDVLVLIRGGGSLEDLQAFSTEPVARAVAASRTPTLSGIGHEVDTSLCDLAADVRAATPTDAARIVVPDRREVGQRVAHQYMRIDGGLRRMVVERERQAERHLARMETFLRRPGREVAEHEARLQRGMGRIEQKVGHLNQLADIFAEKLSIGARGLGREKTAKVTGLERMIRGFDPQATLNRGYAIVRAGDAIVRDPASLKGGEPLVVQLAKGTVRARTEE